jgi:hypothetical protein
VLPLLQDLAAASLNPIHLIGKGKPPLREQRKTFLQGWFDRWRCAVLRLKPNRAYRADVSDIAACPPTPLNAALALPFQASSISSTGALISRPEWAILYRRLPTVGTVSTAWRAGVKVDLFRQYAEKARRPAEATSGSAMVFSYNPGGHQVRTYEEYQQKAAECLEPAHAATDPTNKALLLEMAQAWIRFAEQLKTKGNKPKG